MWLTRWVRLIRVGSIACLAAACSDSPGRNLEEDREFFAGALQIGPPPKGQRWGVHRPAEGLFFSRGRVDLDTRLPGQSYPLEDGGLLVSYVTKPHEYEGLACYLELEPDDEGWRPRAVGLWFGTCTGFWWIDEIHGSVTLDDSDPAELLIAVDLECPHRGDRDFQRSFSVDPRSCSSELRESLSFFDRAPRLGRSLR